jgi:hypothetical protein
MITSTTCDSVYSNKILSGFGHISQELEIQAYPNPVKENLTVKFILHSPSDIKICVNSLIGTKVAEVTTGKSDSGVSIVNVDMSGVANGVYIVEVKTGESVMKKKIQVTR